MYVRVHACTYACMHAGAEIPARSHLLRLGLPTHASADGDAERLLDARPAEIRFVTREDSHSFEDALKGIVVLAHDVDRLTITTVVMSVVRPQVKSSQVKSSQVESSQVKSKSKSKSSQVKSSQV